LRVTSPEALRRQADAVAAVRRARTERDEATEQLKQAIRDAADTGALYKDIALAAGLSRQRVSQIVRGE
jgi:hypothetical protein